MYVHLYMCIYKYICTSVSMHMYVYMYLHSSFMYICIYDICIYT